MEEIKAPLHKRIWYFIWEHVTLIGIIFFFAVVLFSSCGKAKAAEALPDNVEDILKADCTTYNVDYDTYSSTFSTVLDFSENVMRMYNGSKVLYVFTDTQYIGVGNYNYNNSVPSSITTVGIYGVCGVKASAYSITNGTVIGYVVSMGNESLLIYRIRCIRDRSCSGGSTVCYDPYDKTVNGNQSCYSAGNSTNYFTLDTLIGFGSNNDSNPNMLAYTEYASNDDFFFQTSSGYSFKWEYNWEDVYPSAVEDERLKIYTINNNVGQDVVFDLDDFDFSNYDGSEAETQNTLVDNQIVVTVDYDGTEQVYTLDSTNSDVLPAYLIETPLSYFNVDEYNNVKITKVQFSKLIHYRPSEMKPDETESYNIACEYYLKRYTEPIEKGENEYADDLDGTKLTQIDIDKINGKVNFSDGYYSPLGGGGNELVVPYGYNVLYVTITGSRTLASIINEIVTDNYLEIMLLDGNPMSTAELTLYLTQEIKSSITGITSTADAEALIKDMVKNNYYTNMFDIVVYYWAPDSSLGEVDVMYYYLTESGRLRGISQTLADLYVDTNEIKVNTAAIFTAIDNFENESLDYFNAQLGFDSEALDWFKTINNSINSLDFPLFNDDDILDKLDNIATTLFEKLDTIIGNQNSTKDGYPQYIAWVKDSINNSGLHKWANGVIDSLKKAFTFLVPSDLDSEVDGDQTYIWYSNEFFDYVFGDERLTSYLPNDTINIYSYTGGYTYE